MSKRRRRPIIQSLRGRRRAVTAAELAEDLGVSDRTIYRDIRDLVASGTPIEGEAGVGYALKREYDLPPLMFDAPELEALPLGAFFWGKLWTLGAWCELRRDFRTFRLDRIERIRPGEPFDDEEGRTLRDYLRNIGPSAERLLD